MANVHYCKCRLNQELTMAAGTSLRLPRCMELVLLEKL
jgi:hypothetical protein